MDRPLLMALVLAFLLVLLALMLFGWRRRQRSQAGLPRPAGVPDDPGPERLSARGFYVATTIAEDPLNRIAVAGLGYRARAAMSVTDGGVALAIPGQPAIYIPATSIRSVQKATWTIDRAVEQDGLILLRWMLGSPDDGQVEVDSYLRLPEENEAEELFRAMQELHASMLPTTKTPGGRPQ